MEARPSAGVTALVPAVGVVAVLDLLDSGQGLWS